MIIMYKRYWKQIKRWRLWKYFSKENMAYYNDIVSIAGIISIIILVKSYGKESEQERARNTIIEAVAIFDEANDSTGYQKAFELFLEVKKIKPNDITGYRKFLDLADRRDEEIRQLDGKYRYDKKVERYYLYADSLCVYSPNKAENQLKYLRELKKQGLKNIERNDE